MENNSFGRISAKEPETGGKEGVCSLVEGRKNEWDLQSASDVSGDEATTAVAHNRL